MKNTRIILLVFTIFTFLICQNSFCQNNNVDTLFIKKDNLLVSKQSIYFETNKDSKHYKNLTSFEFDEFDKESYEWSLDYLKDNNIHLTKQKNILPSNKWIAIRQYNNEFYAYYPCDFYTFFQVSITDSAYVEMTGEGPVANKILNQRKINNSTFEIKTTGIYEQNRTIKIYFINPEKGIAVFEENRNDGSLYRYLMIESDKIKTIPLIVNHCEIHKQPELEFEKPNFERLIKALNK